MTHFTCPSLRKTKHDRGKKRVTNLCLALNDAWSFKYLTIPFKREKKNCQALTTTIPSIFKRLDVAKQKNKQVPCTLSFYRLGYRGLHDNIGSSIATKKKESTSRMSFWIHINHKDARNCPGKEFSYEAKGEGKISNIVPS